MHTRRSVLAIVPLAAMLSLTGCGGGGRTIEGTYQSQNPVSSLVLSEGGKASCVLTNEYGNQSTTGKWWVDGDTLTVDLIATRRYFGVRLVADISDQGSNALLFTATSGDWPDSVYTKA